MTDVVTKSREEIIEGILERRVYADGPNRAALAWKIKVHSFDATGRQEGFEPAEDFDARWDELTQKDDYLFAQACEDALREYVEDGYPLRNQEERGVAKFFTAGRSGGWLLLKDHEHLGSLTFGSISDFRDSLEEMDDEKLQFFVDLLQQIDQDLENPGQVLAHSYAAIRQIKEEEWAEEATKALANV